MTEEANQIFQWIGVGVVLFICLVYIIRKIKDPKSRSVGKSSGCEGCPLLKDCSKNSCSNHNNSSCH